MTVADADLPPSPDPAADPHYLRAVTDYGARKALVTTAPVFARNGVKLLDAGIRVDPRLYERLAQHRLRVPIDEQLSVADAINCSSLVDEARKLIAERPFCQCLAETLGSTETLLAPLAEIPLPPPIAFKLTLMRDTRPALFLHSLQMTLATIYLARHAGRRARALSEVATAALLHDIGVLHIDPAILAPGHRMSPDERQHLFAHPLTAALLLKPHPEYGPEVVRAITEHHERLDGSGYPRGLHREKISLDGRILMLAEVVSAMFERNWEAPGLRLSLVLRLNHRKFDRDLVNALSEILRRESATLPADAPPADELTRIEHLGDLFADWRRQPSPSGAPHPATLFLDERLRALERQLAEAGVDAAQLAAAATAPDQDPELLSEILLLARETGWQIDLAVQTLQRRWPALSATDAPAAVAFISALDALRPPSPAT